MKVYNYHRTTKVFTSIEDADPDPATPGNWLIPAHATTIPVPELKRFEIAYFNEQEQKWIVVDITPPPPSYDQLRARAYPSIFDYIDGVVKNDHEQINKYIKRCLAVKQRFPKPEPSSYEI